TAEALLSPVHAAVYGRASPSIVEVANPLKLRVAEPANAPPVQLVHGKLGRVTIPSKMPPPVVDADAVVTVRDRLAAAMASPVISARMRSRRPLRSMLVSFGTQIAAPPQLFREVCRGYYGHRRSHRSWSARAQRYPASSGASITLPWSRASKFPA